jgi:hypothetical protein
MALLIIYWTDGTCMDVPITDDQASKMMMQVVDLGEWPELGLFKMKNRTLSVKLAHVRALEIRMDKEKE